MTLRDPQTTLRQETLFYIGSKEANGLSGSDAIITDAIWTEFANRNVRRVDGTQLTYYQSYLTNVFETAGLLKFGDGQCGSWAKFLLDIRKVQGIKDTSDNFFIFTAINGDGFIVNNWTFIGSGHSGRSDYPYLNLPTSLYIGSTSYNWSYEEVNDASGIPGQGTANPASLFGNHQMVFVNGQYYDPSYGTQHPDLAHIQTSLAGFLVSGIYPIDEPTVNLDLNANGNTSDLGVSTDAFLFQKNSTQLNIRIALHDLY